MNAVESRACARVQCSELKKEVVLEFTGPMSCVFHSSNKMASSWFASLNQKEISTLLSEKDSKSTKKATKQFKSIFEEYLHEKQEEYPKNAIDLAKGF